MGRLSLIIGCMFAQKTTELLRRVRRYQSIGHQVLVANYAADTRYGKDRVSSHDKEFEAAVCVDRLEYLEDRVRSGSYHVLAIDEGQFFPDLFEKVTAWADELPIHIVISGLDGTSDRAPFGDMLRLIPHAEEVERLSAFCAVCRDGTVAVYSKYVGQKGDDIVVGAGESYHPVCRRHYRGDVTPTASATSPKAAFSRDAAFGGSHPCTDTVETQHLHTP
jgi:thymidine kinase